MERITPALARAKSLFKKRLKEPVAVASAVARLEADPTGKGIARADVIIEAVVENLEIKQKIFADVEAEGQGRPRSLRRTRRRSSSSASPRGCAIPSRLIGLHFFNPVAQLPLVEVIRSSFNADADVARGASFRARHRQESRSGQERARLPRQPRADALHDGRGASGSRRARARSCIDAAAVAFGMPMGPIELMDTVGLDVGESVAQELGQSCPRIRASRRWWRRRSSAARPARAFTNGSTARRRRATCPTHADLAGLGRELVKPLVDATEIVVGEGVVANADLADIGVILGTGLRAVPRRAAAGAQGREEPRWRRLRKIAIVGSARIPFCRAYTGYAEEMQPLDAAARRSAGSPTNSASRARRSAR